jgi:hypothetical protein
MIPSRSAIKSREFKETNAAVLFRSHANQFNLILQQGFWEIFSN